MFNVQVISGSGAVEIRDEVHDALSARMLVIGFDQVHPMWQGTRFLVALETNNGTPPGKTIALIVQESGGCFGYVLPLQAQAEFTAPTIGAVMQSIASLFGVELSSLDLTVTVASGSRLAGRAP